MGQLIPLVGLLALNVPSKCRPGRPGRERVIALSTALYRYSVSWTQLDWPLDLNTVFGFDGPLDVEIGFGNGAFLADLALASPERQFIGIERSLGSLQRLFSRLESRGIENVRAIQADASFALDRLFGTGDVSRLYVNFPDPWPKERHHNRRLIQPAFVDLVSRRLARDGELMIGTDHADYAAWITEVLEDQDALSSKHATTYVSEIPGRKPTKYEQKAREIGSRIHFFEFEQASSTVYAVVDEQVGNMPNVVLEGPYDSDRLLQEVNLQTLQLVNDGVTVVIKPGNIYREQLDGHLLVEMMVREDAFFQQFGVSVIQRPPEKLLVKLSSIGYPRPTWGVKESVRLVADAILEARGMQVASTTLVETRLQ